MAVAGGSELFNMTQKVFFQRNKTEAATVCGQGGDGKQEGMGWGVGGEWLNLLVPLISVTFLAGKVSPSRPNERTLSLCRGCTYVCVCIMFRTVCGLEQLCAGVDTLDVNVLL